MSDALRAEIVEQREIIELLTADKQYYRTMLEIDKEYYLGVIKGLTESNERMELLVESLFDVVLRPPPKPIRNRKVKR